MKKQIAFIIKITLKNQSYIYVQKLVEMAGTAPACREALTVILLFVVIFGYSFFYREKRQKKKKGIISYTHILMNWREPQNTDLEVHFSPISFREKRL